MHGYNGNQPADVCEATDSRPRRFLEPEMAGKAERAHKGTCDALCDRLSMAIKISDQNIQVLSQIHERLFGPLPPLPTEGKTSNETSQRPGALSVMHQQLDGLVSRLSVIQTLSGRMLGEL